MLLAPANDVCMSSSPGGETRTGRWQGNGAGGVRPQRLNNELAILGIMVNISADYYIESNREYGLGRPDIVIMPKDKSRKAYILKFKNEYTTSKKTAEDAAKEALAQIETKRYEEGLKNTGVKEVVKIGLGFKGKELKIRW